MIQYISNTEIWECPGLVWTTEDKLFLLPLLKDAEVHSWFLKDIPAVLYEKRENPDMEVDFVKVKHSHIVEEFEELLPEYLFGTEGTYTGIFTLQVGLAVTNTSAKVLFELLSPQFYVMDAVTQSTAIADEIKELYQKNILRENEIISYEEYYYERERLLGLCRENAADDAGYERQLQKANELEL